MEKVLEARVFLIRQDIPKRFSNNYGHEVDRMDTKTGFFFIFRGNK